MFGRPSGFGDKDNGGFEIGSSNVLPEEVEVLDKSLDGAVILADRLVSNWKENGETVECTYVLQVKLDSQRCVPAAIVGVDGRSDVAVLGEVGEIDIKQALVGLVGGCIRYGERWRGTLVLKLSLQFLGVVVRDALEDNQ